MHFYPYLGGKVGSAKNLVQLRPQRPLPAQHHQRNVTQVLHFDARMPGQGVAGRHDAHTFGVQHRLDVEVRDLGWQAHKPQVGGTVQHGALDHVVGAGQQLDDGVFMVLEKLCDDLRQQFLGHAGGHPDLEQALARATYTHFIGQALDTLHAVHQPGDLGQQFLCFRCSHQAAFFTQKQRETQRVLQLAKQAADRRLREAHTRRCADGRTGGHDRFEGFELLEIHRVFPVRGEGAHCFTHSLMRISHNVVGLWRSR